MNCPFIVKCYVFCEVASNKGAGSQFGEAVQRIGVDLKPNPATANYEDFRFTEGGSGLGSAFETSTSLKGIGAGVQGRSPQWDETHFLTKSISFYDVFGQGLGGGPAEGD